MVLLNSCKNGNNCKINLQLMNFTELIGLLSEVEICLSSAELHCIAVLHFVTLTNVFLEGAFCWKSWWQSMEVPN